MDISLVLDLALKAALGIVMLGVSWFFGSVFGMLAYMALYPPPRDQHMARGVGGAIGRTINFAFAGAALLMFAWGAIAVIYLTIEHAWWLANGDWERLRIKR